jgi:hypothetical protein
LGKGLALQSSLALQAVLLAVAWLGPKRELEMYLAGAWGFYDTWR